MMNHSTLQPNPHPTANAFLVSHQPANTLPPDNCQSAASQFPAHYLLTYAIDQLNYRQRKSIEDYSSYFQNHHFELFITTRASHSLPIETSYVDFLNLVIKPISQLLSIKLAAVSALIPKTPDEPPHIHTLLLSDDGSLPDHLPAIKQWLSDQIQPGTLLDHRSACQIETIWNHEKVCTYVAANLIAHKGELRYYKERLLIKRSTSRSTGI